MGLSLTLALTASLGHAPIDTGAELLLHCRSSRRSEERICALMIERAAFSPYGGCIDLTDLKQTRRLIVRTISRNRVLRYQRSDDVIWDIFSCEASD